jgi:hypothetical protein
MDDDKCVLEKRDGRYKDTLFDKIKSIEEVDNTTPYAYDLTIEDTRNFNTYNGLAGKDTFHSAGNSSKSSVTRGVPRIEEILNLLEEPKNPSMTIYMYNDDDNDVENIHKIMNQIEYMPLKNIIDYSEIKLDSDETEIPEDKTLMNQYKEFENMVNECMINTDDTQNKSKFILRIKLNREAMLDKNITMDDVHFVLLNAYQDTISCVFSDYNDDNLVFRIRINKDLIKKKTTTLDNMDEIYSNDILNRSVLNIIYYIENLADFAYDATLASYGDTTLVKNGTSIDVFENASLRAKISKKTSNPHLKVFPKFPNL